MIGTPVITSKLQYADFEKYFERQAVQMLPRQFEFGNKNMDMADNSICLYPEKIGSSKKRKKKTNGLVRRLKRLNSGCESNVRLVMISLDKHPTFIGLINESCSISTVKQIFISTFCLNGYTMVGTDLRLLYEAEDLSDQTVLSSIITEKEVIKLYAVFRKPILAPSIEQRSIFATTEPEIAAIKRLKNCKIFIRNFEACVVNASHFHNSADRLRFDLPTTEFTLNLHRNNQVVLSTDLGDVLLDLSILLRKYVTQLGRLSHKLIQDSNHEPGTEGYIRFKADIQNLLDAARYLAPLFLNIQNLSIPLSNEPPRILSEVPHRRRQ